ncbi:hypothetical protein [Snodgrassella communis]|uniref:hypothetical protein n=1 Tax=Snodgrassella communis TaxID=2946699 RepID=UPI000C1E08D5|nr:hypothetical protein [Snodgrassella communis]PIT08973.1 hypothetical protein BGI31_06590 [Snodgrassella communis]
MNQESEPLEIFFQNFNKIHSNYKFWLNASNDNQALVNVLTLHLMCENFLEAYICSRLNISDLFDENIPKKNGKETFRLQFNQKLKFSLRLGLPMEAYEFFEKLNSLRNKFAHNLNTGSIDQTLIDSLTGLVNRMEPTTIVFDVEKEAVQIFDENENIAKCYIFNNINTPNTIRLAILYSFLIRKLIKK